MQTCIQNGDLKAVINHKGAELAILEKNNENYMWEVNKKFWDKTSPILFPIVGGLKNDRYIFDGKEYSLPRHGFAREREFTVVSKTENSVTFSLQYDEESLKIYPFTFKLQVEYSIREECLFVKYIISNLGNSVMLYSIGAHPAFKIDGKFEEYSLEFDHEQTLTSHQLENNLFSGKTVSIPLQNSQLPLSYTLFENDAIVLKESSIQSVRLLHGEKTKLKVDFSDFPYLGIWTKSEAPFICIEPWLGIADNANTSGFIEDKEGIQSLEPHTQNVVEWSVQLF